MALFTTSKCRQVIANNEIGNYQEKDIMKVINLLKIIKQTKLKTVSLLIYAAIQYVYVEYKCLNPLVSRPEHFTIIFFLFLLLRRACGQVTQLLYQLMHLYIKFTY